MADITPEMARKALMARGALGKKKSSEEEFVSQLQGNIGQTITGFLSGIPAAAVNIVSNRARQEGAPEELVDLAKGVSLGGTQGLSDMSLSALNLLRQNKIPHLQIMPEAQSVPENIGQLLGQIGSGFAIPGGGALKIGKLASGTIPKLLTSGLTGAGIGALTDEDRLRGAEFGSALGLGGQGLESALKFTQGIKSKNIAKEIAQTYKNFEKDFEKRFNPALEEGEEAGANNFLNPQKGNIEILKKAGGADKKSKTKDLTYALEEYNKNPTLKNAHYAQRDLNKLANIHKHAPEGTLENKAYKEALKLKNNILTQISHAFEKSGAVKHGENYSQARIDYAKEFGPYLNSKAISNLLGKNAQRTQTLRPAKFADKLLEEEQFLSQAGHRHPGLLNREKTKMIFGNPLIQKGLGGAAIIGGGLLPYEIAKLLGLK